ncbi:hypothetical protein TIFTF001_037947 [Ficus carica]|uniref:DNA mismatch repair proteins mutS family domain-containing protein n=1 Tax=Ficus carica TaxID=3494 RepID=A0AA88E6A9_FICCA|nr:hypothetical protein TIFTF001_037947 [Ficus carica]
MDKMQLSSQRPTTIQSQHCDNWVVVQTASPALYIVSKNMFQTIARDLLLERTEYPVELYEGSGSNWRLVKSGTPGNISSFEDILFTNNEMQDTPVVVALVPNVESALVALGCKECLLPAATGKSTRCEMRTLYDSSTRCGMMLTERKKAEFKTRDMVQDLGRLDDYLTMQVYGSLAGLLSELDVLLSVADLASSCPTPYIRPDITPSDEGDIILQGSRNPCVEAQDWMNFLPNDYELVRGKSWFQIITGPNMGGKSAFIRQVGVNNLMAQASYFVPCDKASISIQDCIFARVGAGDCQVSLTGCFLAEVSTS